jgi:uncharacterized phage-associated protein
MATGKVTVHDVAAYILKQCGSMTTMKLQKLAYYCQAWSLVWDEEPMFPESIEAWASGPVVPALYELHKGKFKISVWPKGNPDKINHEAKDTANAVIKHYGPRPSQWLSDLTHMEEPWRKAREGIAEGERGYQEISHASMHEYYSGLCKHG